MAKPPNIAYVLDLQKRYNFAVIPLGQESKRPAVKWRRVVGGDPFTADEIFGMWRAGLNPGIVCGAASQVIVVDADGPEAVKWCEEHLPPTPWVTLTRHGRHYYYRWPGHEYGNRADVLGEKARFMYRAKDELDLDLYVHQSPTQTQDELQAEKGRAAQARVLAEDKLPTGPVIDIRGDGGQVVAPGAVHPSGFVYEQREAWDPEAVLPTFDPAWFEGRKWKHPSRPGNVANLGEKRAERELERARDSTPDTRLKRARAWLACVEGAVSESGGHNKTFYAACRLVQGFCLDIDTAYQLMQEDYNPRCQPPWSDEELAHKIVDAEKASVQNRGYMLVDRPEFRPAVSEYAKTWTPSAADIDEDMELPGPAEDQTETETVNAADLDEDDRYWVKRWAEPFAVDYLEMKRDRVNFNRRPKDGSWSLPPDSPNILIVLRYSRHFRALRYDVLKTRTEYNGQPMEDRDKLGIKYKLDTIWNCEVSKDRIMDAIDFAARRFEPVREWLEGLPDWDGVERLARVPHEILGAVDAPIHGLMFTHFMTGLVARTMKPGSKVDTIFFLVGPQGVGKSKFFRMLIDGHLDGQKWFTDNPFSLKDKDGKLLVGTHVVIEWSEGEHAKSAKMIDAVKQFLSMQTDDFRSPYGRTTICRPRRCVFVGTSNDEELLHDASGNRRFYVMHTGQRIDIKTMLGQREQLFAEALARYRRWAASEYEDADWSACRWWFEGDEDLARQAAVTRFQAQSPWYYDILNWVEARWELTEPRFTISQVAAECLEMARERKSKRVQSEIKYALQQMGCTQLKMMRVGGVAGRWWQPPARTDPEEDTIGF